MANVKLILVQSIHRLGEAGDLVTVKPGFARNFLLPQGKALLATESRVKEFEHKRRIAEDKAARELKDLQAVKKQLEALKIEVGARAGESGKLFGSVTAAQIADKIEAAGLAIDRRRIDLRDPIKEVGEHKVAVKLRRELVALVTIHVVAEGGPSPEDGETTEEEVDDRRGRGRRRDREDDEEDEEESASDEESEPRS
jgi:large subunit ribosomal protein L9